MCSLLLAAGLHILRLFDSIEAVLLFFFVGISENQDETKSLLHVGRKGDQKQLKYLFEEEVKAPEDDDDDDDDVSHSCPEAIGLWDPVLLGLAPAVPVASSSGAAPSAVGSATINNNDI